MLKNILPLFFLLAIGLSCPAQFAFKGTVTDGENKSPLDGAVIYFPDLQSGQVTHAEGTFTWKNLPRGKYLIQVSYLGYETIFRQVVIPKDSVIHFDLFPAAVQMKEVVITGTHVQAPEETTFQVEQVRSVDLRNMGALSVSDAVARIPGVSQLTTGPGISKPVIRGLHGNRIQVNINGVRFDNQQWQDEHGLGLSDVGVDRIEVIKGPASVLYGSDALGGVLNIMEEKPAALNTTEKVVGAKIFSNTYGLSLRGGLKQASDKRWWSLQAGVDNHADYHDGKNNRVLNSRFSNYSMNAALGRKQGKWINTNRLLTSFSQFGFVFDSIRPFAPDARLSRSYAGPHHQVFMAQVSSENTILATEGKKIKINGGVSTNLRQEDEGGGGISLSMLLNAANVVWQTTRFVSESAEMTYGASGFGQTNTNLGGRVIVPDARTGEVSLFGFYKRNLARWLMEGGLRVDQRWLSTWETKQLNAGSTGPGMGQAIRPFSRSWQAMNASVGSSFRFTSWWSIRANVSSGFRPGNLAELSSNGLHEGSLRWEIGLPGAKVEQNLNAELSLLVKSKSFNASASVYRNQFRNYIYLAPTGQEYFGFNIYRFQQTNASLQGGELQLDWAIAGTPLETQSAWAMIVGQKEDGSYLPFIPANKISEDVLLHVHTDSNLRQAKIRLGGAYIFRQQHPAEFETSTPAYFLLNAGFSTTIKKLEVAVSGTNLLNKTYTDHLSRFKYYGIYNMGRSVVLSMYFKF